MTWNGNPTTGVFNGQMVWGNPVYTLTLQNDGHGTMNAIPLTGHSGDISILSNTPNSNYSFSGYTVTGAAINGNNLTFSNQDCTAKAWFKANSAVYYTNNNSYTRASTSTGTLTFNATANSADYNYFVWKFNAKTTTNTTKYYDFRVTFNSNNLSNQWYVGNPKPITACPLYWRYGATTIPGTTTGCTVTKQSNDVHVYYTGLNTTAARPYKFLYNNSNKTMTIYYNNVAYVTLTGLGTFTAFRTMTFAGNTSYTANGTFSNFSLAGFKDLTAAQAY